MALQRQWQEKSLTPAKDSGIPSVAACRVPTYPLPLETAPSRPSQTPYPAPRGLTPLIKVSVRSNESLEAALRRFKRQCNYSGIFRLAKANTWHEKRSDRRRRERRERLRTVQKATRKNDPNRRRRRRPGGAPKKR